MILSKVILLASFFVASIQDYSQSAQFLRANRAGLIKRAYEQDEKLKGQSSSKQSTDGDKQVGRKKKQEEDKVQQTRKKKSRSMYTKKAMQEAKDRLSPESYIKLEIKAEEHRSKQRHYQDTARAARKWRLATGKATDQDLRTHSILKEHSKRRAEESRAITREKRSKEEKEKQESAKRAFLKKQETDVSKANQAALLQIPTAFRPHRQLDKEMQKSSKNEQT